MPPDDGPRKVRLASAPMAVLVPPPVLVSPPVSVPVPVGDASSGQVIGGNFYRNAIAGEDADTKLPHLACQTGQDFVFLIDTDFEIRVSENLGNKSFKLDRFFLWNGSALSCVL